MDPEPFDPPEAGARSLVKGIFRDAQELLDQHVRLVRSEVKQELRRLKTGVLSVCVGAGIAALGVICLLGMAVHALAASTPIPLWGCYGIVGGALGVVGAGVLFAGRRSVSDVHLAPPPVTARALKEDAEWLGNMKHRKAAEQT